MSAKRKNNRSVVHEQGDASTEEWMKAAWDERAVDGEGGVIHKFRKGQATAEEYWTSGCRIVKNGVLGENQTRWNHIFDSIDTKQSKCLELGCGMGRVLLGISPYFDEVVGIDVSREMLNICREKTKDVANIKVYENNGIDLSQFEDASFDFCYSVVVFQHIPEKRVIKNYMTEVFRILKNNRVFRFQVRGATEMTPESSASTVIGVSFIPDEVHEMVESSGFELLEESGQGSQYHWVSCRKKG